MQTHEHKGCLGCLLHCFLLCGKGNPAVLLLMPRLLTPNAFECFMRRAEFLEGYRKEFCSYLSFNQIMQIFLWNASVFSLALEGVVGKSFRRLPLIKAKNKDQFGRAQTEPNYRNKGSG